MASTQPNKGVLHCSIQEFLAVNILSTRILTLGLYLNTPTFLAPPIAFSVFEAANNELTRFISLAKGNHSFIIQRDEQCILVHGYLSELVAYANRIANHDILIINESGFDSNNQPTPHGVLDAPIINRVVEGKEQNTYKAYLLRKQHKLLTSTASKGARWQSTLHPPK